MSSERLKVFIDLTPLSLEERKAVIVAAFDMAKRAHEVADLEWWTVNAAAISVKHTEYNLVSLGHSTSAWYKQHGYVEVSPKFEVTVKAEIKIPTRTIVQDGMLYVLQGPAP